MERVRFIEHNDKQILHLNFASAKAEEVLTTIEKAKTIIAAQPANSLFTLADVTDAAFNREVSDSMKTFVTHNKPFVKASAVVGITGLKQIIFNAVLKFSGRHIAAFDSLEEAKDWLSKQQS